MRRRPTFRAKDLEKLVAYIDHADVVNGTRIVEQHLGRGTFTDVGTTYKLVRRNSLERIMARLNPAINLEFNAHFLDTALASGQRIVECPITFHPRVGVSKGGNASNLRALRVGISMIVGLCCGWSR